HRRSHPNSLSALTRKEKCDFGGVSHGRARLLPSRNSMAIAAAQQELRPPTDPANLLCFDDRAACVMATVRANDVRRLRRAALRAGLQLLGFKSIVRPTHPGPRIRLFAFRNTHDNTCQKSIYDRYFGLISLR